MIKFRDLPIKEKLTLIRVAVRAVIAILASIVVVINNKIITFISNMAEEFSIPGNVFDAMPATGLASSDIISIQIVLKPSSPDTQIQIASVFRKEGTCLAEYPKRSAERMA